MKQIRSINDIIIPMGFILEVTMFITNGYLLAKSDYIYSLLCFVIALYVAIYTGERIKGKGSQEKSESL